MIKIYNEADAKFRECRVMGAASAEIRENVEKIVENVRLKGDAALIEYSRLFDGVILESLEVPKEEIDAAFVNAGEEFLRVMTRAKENIEEFHRRQVRQGYIAGEENNEGVITGQRIVPIERVGLYIPGGSAAYPSSLLMNCIPAKLAGCPEIIMVSPPTYGDGTISPIILAAAKLAGVDRVFKVGGAQAIAAMAYGTETIPRVYKITGPGNAYVAEAKRQIFGQAAIDMIAGPSEILIVADGKSRSDIVAADMLSQAEHDMRASAILLTDSAELADEVSSELERQIPLLPRKEIARASIDGESKIIVCRDIDSAINLSNEIAPEHLELYLDSPFDFLRKVKNAGSVFLGRSCPEAAGDYIAGPNHTLPTSGTAKFSSPLSVDDFVKKIQFIYYSEDAFAGAADDIAYFAEAEGLSAHARSASIRKTERL